MRANISGNGLWEPIIGYSRAVWVGNVIYVAGTTGMGDDGNIVDPGDPFAQTSQALKNIERALNKAGASIDHVVRPRIDVTNINHWEAVGRAHEEFFQAEAVVPE